MFDLYTIFVFLVSFNIIILESINDHLFDPHIAHKQL